jgi:hypothetical protein
VELLFQTSVHDGGPARVAAVRRCCTAVAFTTAVSAMIVGCGPDDTPAASPPDDLASTSAPSESPATSQAPAESTLEGSWEAGPLSVDETEETLRRSGLGQYVEDYRKNAPFSGETVLTLSIENGAWDLHGQSAGGQPVPIDYDAEYEIEGNTVVFHHSDGSNTYRWEVHQDTMRLHFVQSTLPGYQGIPEEVFQRALYMTEPFTRQG